VYWERTTTYRRTWYHGSYYSNVSYDEVFIRRTRSSTFVNCWEAYPEPPHVRIVDIWPAPPPTTTTTPGVTPSTSATPAVGPASASFSPAVGTRADSYTLSVSGFPPNTTLSIALVRPDAVVERYSVTTNANGAASYTFTHVENVVLGTYAASVSGGGRSARAYTRVVGDSAPAPAPTQPTHTTDATGTPPSPPPDLQCNPPRSQLESEQCAGVD
jgi:hypothetical protein